MYYIYQKSDGYVGCTSRPKTRWRGEKLKILFTTENIMVASAMEQELQFLILGKSDGKVYYLQNNEEACKKVSEALKGRIISEEWKQNMSKAHLGKTLSEEHKHKMSEAQTGRFFSEEHKQKIGEKQKGNETGLGRIWINNGVNNRFILPNEFETFLENGWNKGKILSEKYKQKFIGNTFNKGRIWITDGTNNKFIKPEELEKYLSEGWMKGIKH